MLGRVTRITDNIRDGAPTDGHIRVVEPRAYPNPATVTVTDAWGATTTTWQDVVRPDLATTAPNGLVEVTVYDDVANTETTGIDPDRGPGRRGDHDHGGDERSRGRDRDGRDPRGRGTGTDE